MSFLYNALLVLHFIGLAMLLGGFFAQIGAKPPVVTHWLRDGALLQVITGLVMVGLAEGGSVDAGPFAHAAVGVKLLIAAVIAVLAVFGMSRPAEKQKTFWASCGALALINVVVAVFWLG